MKQDTLVNETDISPYLKISRSDWALLRQDAQVNIMEKEVQRLQGLNDPLTMNEIVEVYLPLCRLLDMYTSSTQKLYETTQKFLRNPYGKVPYVIGIAGSVAVGKSTTARVLQALLARWPHRPKVELVTTDGFLYPNEVLQQRGLMNRKGFPESYDVKALIRCLMEIKSGKPKVSVPLYSHLYYDILPGQEQILEEPDIVIVEGLNVLQVPEQDKRKKESRLFVSDFFDFSIYVDAKEYEIERWYIERFQSLQKTAFREPDSFFRRYADLSTEETVNIARGIWRDINEQNLRDNILPTRYRAKLILEKGANHFVETIRLRKL